MLAAEKIERGQDGKSHNLKKKKMKEISSHRVSPSSHAAAHSRSVAMDDDEEASGDEEGASAGTSDLICIGFYTNSAY